MVCSHGLRACHGTSYREAGGTGGDQTKVSSPPAPVAVYSEEKGAREHRGNWECSCARQRQPGGIRWHSSTLLHAGTHPMASGACPCGAQALGCGSWVLVLRAQKRMRSFRKTRVLLTSSLSFPMSLIMIRWCCMSRSSSSCRSNATAAWPLYCASTWVVPDRTDEKRKMSLETILGGSATLTRMPSLTRYLQLTLADGPAMNASGFCSSSDLASSSKSFARVWRISLSSGRESYKSLS
mmetsp:Transcript_46885/g.105695  ORF Transcript_46885/g.105695 Transcript_46885/m.105695 type:complete len:239 (-) Transcript_46885:846-1562(-)